MQRHRYGFLVFVVILVLSVYYLNPGITSFVTVKDQVNYVDIVDLEFSENSEYIWNPENVGIIKSLRLSGSYEGIGQVKIYLDGDDRLLIFNSDDLETGNEITGLATSENVSIDLEETVNNSKSINLNLEFGDSEFYDEDNDGIESIRGVIDLSVKNSKFNWEVNESNLCTRWKIESDGWSTTICNGGENCCGFIELSSSSNLWDDDLYMTYGLYGSSYSSKVSAQTIYADYGLKISSSEIFYSEWLEEEIEFIDDSIKFDSVCTETCLLSMDNGNYKLIIEVNNSILRLNEIQYSVEDSKNIGPQLLKNITNYEIDINSNLTLDLNEYFFDVDEMGYTYFEVSNIDVIIEDNIATIIPNEDYIGNVLLFFTADDGDSKTVSNVFSINYIFKETLEELRSERVVKEFAYIPFMKEEPAKSEARKLIHRFQTELSSFEQNPYGQAVSPRDSVLVETLFREHGELLYRAAEIKQELDYNFAYGRGSTYVGKPVDELSDEGREGEYRRLKMAYEAALDQIPTLPSSSIVKPKNRAVLLAQLELILDKEFHPDDVGRMKMGEFFYNGLDRYGRLLGLPQSKLGEFDRQAIAIYGT